MPRLHIAGPLLTLEQAASLLGVTAATLRQRVQAGHLLTFRRGRLHYTTRKWVELYRAEHQGKPGRPRLQLPLSDAFARLVAHELGLDLPATFEELDLLLCSAARTLVLERPRTGERELAETIAAYRAILVDGEDEAHRADAVQAIVEAVLSDLAVADARYRARREDARLAPSALGTQWKERFRARLAALTIDPRLPGSIARLDVAVATELAAQLRRDRPQIGVQELAALLAQAMLEGSENLPSAATACREMIDAAVHEALQRSQKLGDGRQVSVGIRKGENHGGSALDDRQAATAGKEWPQ